MEEEIFDRYIRSESDLQEKFRYICRNPWDAGVAQPNENYSWLWTQEDVFRNPGEHARPGRWRKRLAFAGFAEQNSFRRDAETHARDGRAPQTVNAARAMNSSMATCPPTID